MTFFIYHATLCDYMINMSCDLMSNRLALKPKTLSSLVAIGLPKVEIKRFHLSRDNLITQSKRQKTQWMVALYYKPPSCQVWQLQASWKRGYIVFHYSRDFMWPCNHRVNSAKCGGHKSCGSEDMIYFNLSFKNKETYDYLITKCGNSISQAFLTYSILQRATK